MILNNNQLDELIRKLKDDQVIGLPTETVMGLGITFASQKAYDNLKRLKNRPNEKSFPLVVASPDLIGQYGQVTPKIQRLIDKYLPGPLTLVLKKTEKIQGWMNNDSDTIAIRVPQNEGLTKLLEILDQPIFLTSANYSSFPPAVSDEEVEKLFPSIAILEGKAQLALPSTIIDVSGDEIKLLRQGALDFADICRYYKEEKI